MRTQQASPAPVQRPEHRLAARRVLRRSRHTRTQPPWCLSHAVRCRCRGRTSCCRQSQLQRLPALQHARRTRGPSGHITLIGLKHRAMHGVQASQIIETGYFLIQANQASKHASEGRMMLLTLALLYVTETQSGSAATSAQRICLFISSYSTVRLPLPFFPLNCASPS